jgi:putative flippase GtrA
MSGSLENRLDDAIAHTPRYSVKAEFVSFLIVGGLAAVSYAALSTVMIGLQTGIPDWIVSALCYAAFILPVYLAHRYISFRSSTPHGVALPRYVAVQVVALTLAAIFSFVCYSILGMPSIPAALMVIGLTSGASFLMLRLWAFATGGR